MKYLSFDEIVEHLMLYKLDERTKLDLGRLSIEEVDLLHKVVGRLIRQEYRLHDPNNPTTMLDYKPIIVDGVDVNPKHPEVVSRRVLLAIREYMK